MSITNFKPTVWSNYIQTQLPKLTVFKNDCDFKYEGDAGRGKRVKILGLERPVIKTYTPGQSIEDADSVSGTEKYLDTDQFDYFNYGVDDVDKAQSVDGLMQSLADEATRALAEREDVFIAKDIAQNATGIIDTTVIKTPEEAKTAIDKMFVALWEKGVSAKDSLCLYLSPWLYDLFEQKIVEIKTDNNRQLENGLVGMYRGAKVKMTNSLYNDGEADFVILKTTKAYAYCNGIDEVQAYCPENKFMDAVKGLNTYGGLLVRPDECVVLKATQEEA